ncbi:MAG TPA: 6-bladed beta-propeller [Candidatus Aminicenantes bacterium]|nr:6-bladed beta-propeller [Candidatus Aminicenantes bacterium]
MKRTLVTMGILVLFFLGANFLPAKSFKVTLQEEMRLGKLDDDLIFMWVGITVDEQGYIYLTDALDYSLKKFSPQGKLVKKVGRRGQGPGEFLAPREVQLQGNYVLVTDQNIRGISVFDRELNYLRRIPFPNLILDMKPLSGQKIALIPVVGAGAGQVKLIDFQGKLMTEFTYTKAKQLMLDFATLTCDQEGNIYVAFTFQDKIEKYNSQGKKVWTKRILKVKSVSREKVDRFEVPTRVVYKDISINPDGQIFVLGGHYAQHPSRDVFILDPNGRYLTSFTLPEESHTIHVGPQGYLYARGNNGVSLRKFKIIYHLDSP